MKLYVKQTLRYTSGLFRGLLIHRFVPVYTDKQRLYYMTNVEQFGSPVKLICSEVVDYKGKVYEV